MKLIQLKILNALVDNNFNITKAAKQLKIAQSAASRQLMLLERELKVELFIRKGKRFIKYSDTGSGIDGFINRILLEEKNILQFVSSLNDNTEKILTLATTHTQARYFLPHVISKLSKKFPILKFRIEQGTPQQVADLLDKNKVSFALCTEMLDTYSDFKTYDCYQWNHIAIVAKNHPLASIGTVKLKTLSEYNLITYNIGFTGRSVLNNIFTMNKLPMRVVLSATDSDVIKTFVKQSLGVGIINQLAFQEEDKNYLVIIPIQELRVGCVTKLAIKKSLYLPRLFKEVIHFILDEGKRIEKKLIIKSQRFD
ncbi:MAG: LysR substrate-binding domain-containing protein [Methylacidiphilales bacterium]|nr:LysR substrate-binding domain-containing protein [Candidatus Methylacidiphilales bacterium]